MLMIGTRAGGSDGPPRAPVILASVRAAGGCSNRRIIRLSPVVVVRPPLLPPAPRTPPPRSGSGDDWDVSSAVAAAAPLRSDGPAGTALPTAGRKCISMPGRRGNQPAASRCETAAEAAEAEATLGATLA